MTFLEQGQRIICFTKARLVHVLALILIVSGGYEIYCVISADYSDQWGFIDEVYSAIIKIIVAEFILFDPKKNVLRAMGFYAMSIGLTRIISSLSMLINTDTISLAIGGTTLVMGANMLISSYHYINDTTRGRTGMIVSASILSIMQAVMLMMDYESRRMGTSLFTEAQMVPMIISLFQYIVLLLIMDTMELRYSTSLEKSNTRIQSASVTYSVAGDLLLTRKDAMVLRDMFVDRSSWHPVEDGGPVESEIRLHTINGRIPSCMILQKWKDSDKIHVTVVNDDSESVILANRYSVSRVVADDGLTNIRLFDDSRMLMQFGVEPIDPEDAAPTEVTG